MVEILNASLRDLSDLRKLEQACFAGDSWPLLDLIAVLSWPNVVRLKAIVNGQMVGFIAGEARGEENVAWIATLGVLPSCRRQGIGTALLTACEARLPQSRLRLCVRRDNVAAIRLYEKAGYRPFDTWHHYYRDGGDALVMEKVRHREHLEPSGLAYAGQN